MKLPMLTVSPRRVTFGPQPMVVVPAARYCVIDNPVARAEGLVAFDEVGQARLRHGEQEVRLHQRPFPLYPGETLAGDVQPLPVVGVGKALRLCATQDTTDNDGTQRKAGDEWLVTKKGAYVPAVGVEVVGVLELERITLTNRQYCVGCIPVVGDKPQRRILRGPLSSFLQPGEVLEGGIRDILFLEAHEALDFVAREAFTDETVTPAVSRGLGDRWTARGPAAVTPPVEAELLRRHSVIPLGGPSDGVYVQNAVTGELRAELGRPYLLTADEQLWSKELSPDAEKLLAEYRRETGAGESQRDKTRVVTFCVSNDRYALVENLSTGKTREVSGPGLAILQPDEQFRVFSLPGGTPVVVNHSQSLTLPWLNQSQHLSDVFTVMTESQGSRVLTAQVAWRLSYPTSDTIAKNGADVAFLQLKHRLLADAVKNNHKDSYEIGEFRYDVIISRKNADAEKCNIGLNI